MKNIASLVLLSFLSFTALAAYSQNPQPLNLAAVVPVSGQWGSFGNDIVRGAELAIDDLKDEYGPIKLHVEDACLAIDTVKAATKLVTIDKINAVVGSYCVVGMVPMAGILEKNKVLGFHTSAVADEILNAGNYIFTTNITIADEAKALARYAYNNLGARRAGTLYLLTQWGLNYNKYFSEEFKALGGVIVGSYESPIGVTDFRTELLKLSTAKPDVLFFGEVGTELGAALKQARQIGLNAPVLGAHEAEGQVVIDIAGKDAEGLTFLSPRLPSTGDTVAKFRKQYREKYSSEPGVLAANGYDATILTVKTLRQCNLDTTCAKDELYRVKDFNGVSGTFSITPEGGTIKEFVRKYVEKGKFKEAS